MIPPADMERVTFFTEDIPARFFGFPGELPISLTETYFPQETGPVSVTVQEPFKICVIVLSINNFESYE